MKQEWAREFAAGFGEQEVPILCSYVEPSEYEGEECGFDAVFSFLIRDGKHLEVCALHFSAAWLRGLIENYGSVHDMAVLQECR